MTTGIAFTMPVPSFSVDGFLARARPTSSILTINATTPYTPAVMTSATTISEMRRIQKPISSTADSEMTMISADKMRSVRTAPRTICFSSAAPWNDAGGALASECPVRTSQIFSAPSKHKKRPPTMSRGVKSQGVNSLISMMSGKMITSLLMMDPRAIFHTTGSSRCGVMPWT